MKYMFGSTLAGVTLMLSAVMAQQPATQPAKPADQVGLPKSQVPTLGRPTRPDDPAPILNFDEYFNGKWNFTWDVPEGPLGPAGTLTGTTVYKTVVPGRFYEGLTEATGPNGPVKITETIAYLKDNKSLSRVVTDSRGFSYFQVGTVAGDLGGYFNIYFESAPFQHGGKSVRLKNAIRLLSPVNYKVAVTMSVDDRPFTNYGNPWWQKDVPGVTK